MTAPDSRQVAEPREPQRIRRSRAKGWRLPAGAVIVDRTSEKWGNPFKVGEVISRDSPLFPYIARTVPGGTHGLGSVMPLSAEAVVEAYGWWFIEQPALMLTVREELGGRDLACWCRPGAPCHADFLLAMANDDTDPPARPHQEQTP